MKKSFLLFCAALATSIVASAGTVTSNCVLYPLAFGAGTGSGTVTCPGLSVSPAPLSLTSVTLNYAVDFQFASAVPASVNVTFTPTAPGNPGAPGTATFNPATLTLLNQTASGATVPAGSGNIVTGSASANANVTLANFANSFTVGISSSLVSGTVATSSGAVTVTYNYVDATPEPATLSLIGFTLAGLGLASRRRNAGK